MTGTGGPRRRHRPERSRRQHAPIDVHGLRDALAAYTGEDSPVGIDPTRLAYVRVGGPDGRLYPLTGVVTSTHLGHRILILDGTDIPGETADDSTPGGAA